jgi:hypothetical protein
MAESTKSDSEHDNATKSFDGSPLQWFDFDKSIMRHSRKTAGRTLGENLWLHKNDVATVANRKDMRKLLLDQILQTKGSKDYQFYSEK